MEGLAEQTLLDKSLFHSLASQQCPQEIMQVLSLIFPSCTVDTTKADVHTLSFSSVFI